MLRLLLLFGAQSEFESGGSRRAGRGPIEDPSDDNGWADYGTRESRDKENVTGPTRYCFVYQYRMMGYRSIVDDFLCVRSWLLRNQIGTQI